MATEEILMAATTRATGRGKKAKSAAGDRQALHEVIRTHSHEAARQVKLHGRPNDLIERLGADEAFAGIDLKSALDPKRFVGRAPEQVSAFLREVVRPILNRHRAVRGRSVSLHV